MFNIESLVNICTSYLYLYVFKNGASYVRNRKNREPLNRFTNQDIRWKGLLSLMVSKEKNFIFPKNVTGEAGTGSASNNLNLSFCLTYWSGAKRSSHTATRK